MAITRLHDVAALRAWRHTQGQDNRRVALVPTMGNLHRGHLALLDSARAHADVVIASIFVNPLQFGPNEDFDRYPRTLEADVAALEDAGCDAVFAPSERTLYPHGRDIAHIHVPHLGDHLCGADRPGHFDGVTTVVALLFHLVQPDAAVFGRKDYQQLQLIQRMVRDLHFPIRVIGHPIEREADGLALSSRNQYLSAEERVRAPALHATLRMLAEALAAGERDIDAMEARGRALLEQAGLAPSYLRILSPDLQDPEIPGEVVIVAAARLGDTRLIDNLMVHV
ncbi:MAG: pantoate--beta-alanine ligase [Algiphilus sp.]|uniref:pantoate--beta-alanine ligase n=1 Tax=Algiphilus sp. TaxID=1872431 RepID=UPI0025C3FA8B|nr:pantoate--beta-alanine ligase [Algiphilus sp.]MCI5103589.1 pantoate--beta-alanine ligase [Algiphilus sp.]